MRGRHEPANKLSNESYKLMKDHIESYHPSVRHYRREHAPLRRYLPPELSVRSMYDFIQKNPSVASYETYGKTVSSLNISFAKLGQEECLLYEKHKHAESYSEECLECEQWKKHIERARISRKHYQDEALCDFDPAVAVMSADMQLSLIHI